jgi:hypothetical protein
MWSMLACTLREETTISEKYATVSEASHSKGLERGVIPQWMPDVATDLQITADLDKGIVALGFAIPSDFDLEKHLGVRAVEASIDDRALRGQAGVGEWPDCARSPSGRCAEFRYFVLEGDNALPTSYVAEDRAGHRVYWLRR